MLLACFAVHEFSESKMYCSFYLKNLKNIERIYAQRPMKQSLLVSAQWFIKIRTQEVSPTCLIHFPSFSHPVLQCSCLQGAEQDTTCRPSEERTCWDCGDISMRLLSYFSFLYSFHCLFILEMVGGLAVQLKDLKFWWLTSWQVPVLAWRRF